MAGTDPANGWKHGHFTPRPSLGVKFEKERPGEVAPRDRASPLPHQHDHMAPPKARRKPYCQEERMRVALEEVPMNVPVRQAASRAHIPKSTLQYRAARITYPTAHKAGRPTALTVSEVKADVDLIVQHADGVGALTTSEVADAVAAIVSRMP
jgi:hypothetical protein